MRTAVKRFMIEWGWRAFLWTGYVALVFTSWVMWHG